MKREKITIITPHTTFKLSSDESLLDGLCVLVIRSNINVAMGIVVLAAVSWCLGKSVILPCHWLLFLPVKC
jgi:hypothetical protein